MFYQSQMIELANTLLMVRHFHFIEAENNVKIRVILQTTLREIVRIFIHPKLYFLFHNSPIDSN